METVENFVTEPVHITTYLSVMIQSKCSYCDRKNVYSLEAFANKSPVGHVFKVYIRVEDTDGKTLTVIADCICLDCYKEGKHNANVVQESNDDSATSMEICYCPTCAEINNYDWGTIVPEGVPVLFFRLLGTIQGIMGEIEFTLFPDVLNFPNVNASVAVAAEQLLEMFREAYNIWSILYSYVACKNTDEFARFGNLEEKFKNAKDVYDLVIHPNDSSNYILMQIKKQKLEQIYGELKNTNNMRRSFYRRMSTHKGSK